jgi:hypothetical protein
VPCDDAVMRPVRIALWLAPTLFVSACSSGPIGGQEDAGVEAAADVATVQCGPALSSGADCESCAAQSCCAQSSACSRDPVCSAHLACVNACAPSDHACLTTCASVPDGGADDVFEALLACELDQCETQCAFASLACGGLSSSDPTCDTCVSGQCCAQESAVGTNIDAIHYTECAAACVGNPPCLDTCALQHPTGWSPARDLEQCTQQKCLGTCPNPSVDCVGHVPPQTLVKSAIQYGLQIVDYVSKAPVAGALVSLCDRADVACQSPLAQGQTNPNGQVGFFVPVSSPGFTGFVDVSAFGYYPAIVVTSSPLVEDTFAGVAILLPSAAAAIAQQAGTTIDPSRASLAMVIDGCDGRPLPYVSLSLDTADGATKLHYIGQNATTTTSSQGIGIAFNAPVAPAKVTATFPLTGQVVSSVSGVPVRKATLTEVTLRPN